MAANEQGADSRFWLANFGHRPTADLSQFQTADIQFIETDIQIAVFI
jgi:hypothetical protein